MIGETVYENWKHYNKCRKNSVDEMCDDDWNVFPKTFLFRKSISATLDSFALFNDGN